MSKELIKLLRAEIARTVDLDMMHHNAANRIEELEREVESLKASMYGHYELEAERDAIKADSDAASGIPGAADSSGAVARVPLRDGFTATNLREAKMIAGAPAMLCVLKEILRMKPGNLIADLAARAVAIADPEDHY